MTEQSIVAEILENDPLQESNLTTFYDQMKSNHETLKYFNTITEILRILLTILLILIDIFLIHIFRRHPKLTSKINQYIIHYSICHIIFLVSQSLVFDVFILFRLLRYLPRFVFGVCHIIQHFTILLGYLFALGIGLEWLYAVYCPNFGQYIRFIYNHSIVIFYFIGCGIYVTLVTLKLCYEWFAEFILWMIMYSCFIVFILACKYLQYRRRHLLHENNYFLNISMVLILFWLPLYIYSELLSWAHGSHLPYTIILYTMLIPEWFAVSTPIGLVIILREHDEHVRRAIDTKSFCGLKKSQRNSEDETGYNLTCDTTILDV